MACGTPHGACTRIVAIGQAEFLQGEFERRRRRATKRLGPERARCTAKQQAADVMGDAWPLGELFQDGCQYRAYVDAVGPAEIGLSSARRH
jgi:hypothetical protein